MIHIEQNQSISENENIFVASPTGDYEDNALIEFYNSEDPEKILGAFAAQYVKYGGLVYKFNDPKELGAEILKLEPESTHSAASFVRMQNELLKQFNQGSLEPESLTQAMVDEQATMQDQMTNPINPEEAVITPPDTTYTTSTEPVNNSTTTTPITTPTIPEISNPTNNNTISSTTTLPDTTNQTTTPAVMPEATSTNPVNNSTTTQNIVEQIIDTASQIIAQDPTSTIPISEQVAGASTSTITADIATTTPAIEVVNTASTTTEIINGTSTITQ